MTGTTQQREDLATALDGFWLTIAGEGRRMHGQIADPGEVADVLHATLSRIAAERRPDMPAETRIRWQQRGSCEDWTGYIGGEMLFRIFATGRDRAGWAMVNSLPGLSDRTAKGAVADDPDAGKLKAEAERWLEEFVTSLGAVFAADDDSAEWDDMEDEEAFRARNAPGRRVRFAHPDGGYPADQEMAAALLTPGDVYTIAWSDIGFSNTRLGLAGIKDHGQGFNSVLFEPVDDPGTAASAAREEE